MIWGSVLGIVLAAFSVNIPEIARQAGNWQNNTGIERSSETETASQPQTEEKQQSGAETDPENESAAFRYEELPEYDGHAYTDVHHGVPFFAKSEIVENSYEKYGELDSLGRCTAAIACLSVDTMPKEGEKRGEIGMIKPSGWVMKKYDCVNGKYAVNRAHMIAWCLGNENQNPQNLVTGSRYMNLEMEKLESETRKYIRKTHNHVMYRVTPVFVGGELMCRGLLMEVLSVEDHGEGITACRFYYNVQPGLEFDYRTGDSAYTGVFQDKDSPAVIYFEEPADKHR